MIAPAIGALVGVVLAIVVVAMRAAGSRAALVALFRSTPTVVALVFAGALLSALMPDNDIGPIAFQVGLAAAVAVVVALLGVGIASAESAAALRRRDGRGEQTRK